jgi:hypothetical protein
MELSTQKAKQVIVVQQNVKIVQVKIQLPIRPVLQKNK